MGVDRIVALCKAMPSLKKCNKGILLGTSLHIPIEKLKDEHLLEHSRFKAIAEEGKIGTFLCMFSSGKWSLWVCLASAEQFLTEKKEKKAF